MPAFRDGAGMDWLIAGSARALLFRADDHPISPGLNNIPIINDLNYDDSAFLVLRLTQTEVSVLATNSVGCHPFPCPGPHRAIN